MFSGLLHPLLALTVGFESPVWHQPQTPGELPAIEWQAPPECPGVAELQRILGQSRDQSHLRWPREIQAKISRDDGGAQLVYRLRLRFRYVDAWTEREVEAQQCGLLVRVAATTLAIHARSSGPERRSPSSGARARAEQAAQTPPLPAPTEAAPVEQKPPVEPAPPPEPRPPQIPPTVRETATESPDDNIGESTVEPKSNRDPRRTRRWPDDPMRWKFGVAALGGARVLPQVTGGVELEVGFRPRLFELRLGLRYWPPRRHPALPGVSGRASFEMWSATFHTCFRPSFEHIELLGCASVEGGLMLGRGRDLPNAIPGAEAAPWLGVGGQLGLRHLIDDHWSMLYAVSGLAGLLRPSYGAVGDVNLHEAGGFGIRLVIGVEYRWSPRIGTVPQTPGAARANHRPQP